MAKSKSQIKREATQGQQGNGGTPSRSLPQGYRKRTSEVVGFWTSGATPIHFIPREARAVDNSIDASKPSILIIGESLGSADANEVATSDGEVIATKQGDLVGIWYKPGMKALTNLMGVPVYMWEEGSRDTGKKNPMKLYEVLSPKTGEELTITGDFRRRSARAELPFRSVVAPSEGDVPEAYGDEQET